MIPLQKYLRTKGWICDFDAPVGAPDGSRIICMVYLSPIHSTKHQEIARQLDGKKIMWEKDIVVDTYRIKFPGTTITALTKDTHTTIFMQSLTKDIGRIADACGQYKGITEPTRDIESYYRLQWGDVYDKYGSNSPKFINIVDGDIMNNTIIHEQEHLEDLEAMKNINNPGIDDQERARIGAFLETRGLLKSMGYGPAPIYAFAHILDWANMPSERNYLAAKTAIGAMSKDGIMLTHDKETSNQLLKFQAMKGLSNSDAVYTVLVKHLNEKYPLQAALKELGKKAKDKKSSK
jgi:hypothetical protein